MQDTKQVDHDYKTASFVAKILQDKGFEAYFIGGAVRDLLLGRNPKDFDIVTSATPTEILSIKAFDGSKFTDPAQAFGVTRVKVKFGGQLHTVDVATFRRDIDAHLGRKDTRIEFTELEEDVIRRDFTINALALDPITNQLFDLVGGLNDLDKKQINFIGDPETRIKEDPLRIMRAVRIKNRLGFGYGANTKQAIKSAVKNGVISNIATDRLRGEMSLILISKSRVGAVEDLDELGILELILPEVVAGKGVGQPKEFHHEGDVWVHQLLTLGNLPLHPSTRLAWASLLHDIGKAKTASKDKDRIRFNKHYEVGAEMARVILGRLNFSKKETEDICWMINNHMSIDDLPAMRAGHRYNFLSHPAFEDLFTLHKADAMATSKKKHEIRFKEIEEIWQDYQATMHNPTPSLKRDLKIDGNWVEKHFGKLDGKLIGKILAELDELYMDGVRDIKVYEKKTKEIIKR